MAKYLFDAEGIPAGTTISTSTVGTGDTPWGAATVGAGATLTADDQQVAFGARSIKLVSSKAQTVGRWTVPAHGQGALRLYVRFEALPTGNITLIWLGSSSTTLASQVTITPAGAALLYGSSTAGSAANSGGILTAGTWYGIDLAYTAAAAGSLRCAVYDLAAGTTVWDTGAVAVNTGAPVTFARIGQYNSSPSALGTLWLDAIELDDAATGLLGPKVPVAPSLDAPVVTVTATAPSAPGASDGTVRASWPAVAGATRYETALLAGTITTGAVADDSNATSPKTYSGLAAGTYTVAVRAIG